MKPNLEKEFADWALIELIDRQLHLATYAHVYVVSLYRTLHYTTLHNSTHLITERALASTTKTTPNAKQAKNLTETETETQNG